MVKKWFSELYCGRPAQVIKVGLSSLLFSKTHPTREELMSICYFFDRLVCRLSSTVEQRGGVLLGKKKLYKKSETLEFYQYS